MRLVRQINWISSRNLWTLMYRASHSFSEGGAQQNVKKTKTRSNWLNCALRDDEAVYWVSIGHYEAVAVGN